MLNLFAYFIIIVIGVLIGWVTMEALKKPFEAQLEEERFIAKVQNRDTLQNDPAATGSGSMLGDIGKTIEKFIPTSRANLIENQSKLDTAGIKRSAGEWHGITLFLIVVCGVLGLFASFLISGGFSMVTAIICIAIGAAVGWGAPQLYLMQKIKERQAEIEKRLPDALERLANITLSGLTVDEAFQELSRADDLGAIGEEFARVSREINYVNVPREEALLAMAQRCQCVDVTFFVSSIIQAMKDGTPVANALQQQAVNARAAWFDRIKEEINKLDTKITIPLGLFYMPATMLLVVAPVFWQAFSSFTTLF